MKIEADLLKLLLFVNTFWVPELFTYTVLEAGDLGLIPGSGRSPGGGSGNPLQYSCLENPWTVEPAGLWSTGSQRVGHD